MSKIRVLPDSLANKIAAGEVVERPSSVVKELLENSIDAGARKVNMEVEAGGKRLIRIIDDGEGMTRDDAITAFERHATSKLRSVEDLEAITTLGFRGEALPSIAAVSRLFLRTKTAADVEGTEVEFNGGRLVAVRDIAWPGGTELEVKDLFFNVPARRKFLKSDATESFHITSLVQHYALANPEVTFLLVNNGRDSIRVAPARTLKERAYQLLGGGLLEKLVRVEHELEGCRIDGYVSNPQEQRASRDAQYLFINGRFVRDQLISRALKEAYRSMMPTGTYPAAILFIEVPPTEVDVNVHPAKTEVRFLNESAMLSFVRSAVADALTSTQPVTRLPGTGASEQRMEYPGRRAGVGIQGSGVREEESLIPDSPLPAPGPRSSTPAFQPPSAPRYPLPGEADAGEQRSRGTEEQGSGGAGMQGREKDAEMVEATTSQEHSGGEAALRPPTPDPRPLPTDPRPPIPEEQELPGLGHGIKPMGQIRDSYIAATDEEGLLLIDQHAAHERVLFEQFRDVRLPKSSGAQPLLIPETLDCSPAEREAFEAVQSELESMGIETMELSGRTIAVKTAPAGIAPSDAIALVREVLSVVESERRSLSIDHIRDTIAASLACKAAIKVNMPLTFEKMQWLIDELMKTKNPMTCPHGRPAIMRFGLREIERGFKRPV